MRVTICGISLIALLGGAPVPAAPTSSTDTPAASATRIQAAPGDTLASAAACVEHHPDNVRARYLLAMELARSGFRSLATEQLDAADKMRPGYVLDLFRALIKKNDRQGAQDLLFYAQLRAPNDPQVLQVTAASLTAHQRPDMARALLSKALQLAPRQQGLRVDLSRLQSGQTNWQAAYDLSTEELQLYPDSLPAKVEQARALIYLHRSPQIVADTLRQAYARQPADGDISYLWAHFLCQQGRYEEALEPLLRSVSTLTAPEQYDAIDQLMVQLLRHVPATRVSLQANQFGTSIADAFPQSFYRQRLGNIFDRAGLHRLANQQYRQALSAHPFFAGSAAFRLARNLDLQFQQPAQAMPFYELAHQLKPYDKQVANMLARARSRMTNRRRDIAWQLKSALWRNVNK